MRPKPPFKTTRDEVHEHLTEFEQRYKDLLEAVRKELEEFRRPPNEAGIRDVYSRGEKQSGDEFKKPDKIAAKLQERRKIHPGLRVNEIGDIIGMTTVCFFPSDVDRLRKLIKTMPQLTMNPKTHSVIMPTT